MRTLREKELVNAIVYWGVSKTGTMQKLNFLTLKGAAVMADITADELENIKFPKSTNTLVKNDFFHRIRTIDLQLAYDERISTTIFEPLFFDVYFDKVGSQRAQTNSNLKSKTRVDLPDGQFIDPDALFWYDDTEGVRLFVLEVANGYDTQRIVKQISNVVFGVYSGAVAEKYGFQTTPRILIALEHLTTQKAVMEQVRNDTYLNNFNKLHNYLFFTTIEAAKQDRTHTRMNLEWTATNIWI